MKNNHIILFTLFIFLFSGAYIVDAQTFDPNSNSNYKLIWEDNFNSFNNNIWNKANEFDHYGEAQVYLNSQSIVSSGYLNLKLEKLQTPFLSSNPTKWGCKRQWYYANEYLPNTSTVGYKYKSGYISTTPLYKIPINTYVEARIKLPHQIGFWPAFWLFGSTDNNNPEDYEEIDIFEMLGHQAPYIVGTNTWIGRINNTNIGNQRDIELINHATHPPTVLSYADTFLIFGVDWKEDFIKYYVNGRLYETKINNGIYNPKKLILNFAISYFSTDSTKRIPDLDANNNPIYQANKILLPSFNNATMVIDWVKVWEYNTDTTLLNNKSPYIINPLNDTHNHYYNSNGDTLFKKMTTIRWQINNSVFNNSNYYCKMEYSTDSLNLTYSINNIPQISSDHLYSIKLTNLTPNTKYYYKVSVNGYNGSQPFFNIHSFISAPAEDAQNTMFYAYGDTRGSSRGKRPPNHNAVCSAILDEIAADPNSKTLLLHMGDWVNDDSEMNWNGEFFNVLDDKSSNLRSNITIMGTKGNHESNANGGTTYRKYFPFPYKSYISSGNKWSYSFDYGPVHITNLYVEGTNYNLSQAEIDWLDYDLSKTSKKWKVIMFHAPIKNLYGYSAGTITINAIKQKAKQYGVQVVLMGHEHIYGHWVEDGTHYMTLGGGGAYIESIKYSTIQSEDEIYAATAPQFAKFDIQNDVMKVDIVQADSTKFNSDNPNYPSYPSGRKIEKFSIPISTQITNVCNFNNSIDYPILTDNITIKQGGVLTVNSTVNIAKHGSIVIEKGGKLIVDGVNSLVSNTKRNREYLLFKNVTDGYYTEDDNMWQGIIVQGEEGSAQTPETNQGVLEMRNGATIENAEIGITVGQQAGTSSRGGGIIKIVGANFINNQRDIIMYPYEIWSSVTAKPIPQESYIKLSTFESDENIILDNFLYGKMQSIGLSGITEIEIQGNTFINNDSNLNLWERGIAISAVNSSINVEHYCDPQIYPCTNVPNTFTNLTYGISAYNGLNSENLIKISKNNFINTYRAILLSGTKGAEVLLNNIELGDELESYGIYLKGGKGFRVEENTIWRPASNGAAVSQGARGIIVHKTGAVNNQIYKNTLTNLFVSDQAQCYNSGTDLPPWYGGNNSGAATGLKFFCNTSQTSSTSYDMWMGGMGYCIPNISSLIGAHRFGIAKFQKNKVFDPIQNIDVFTPAGNQFSTSHSSLPSTAVVDFDNGDAGWLEYSWADLDSTAGSLRWEPTKKDNVTNQEIQVNFDVCPSKITTGGNGNDPTELYRLLGNAQIELNSSIVLLKIWENGGNINLDEYVETILPWDVYREYNDLMSISPYLSEGVMIGVIGNSAFTPLMIKLLMIANPHLMHSGAVLYELEIRIPTFPQSYFDEILSQPDASSQLATLEGNVATDNHLVSMLGEDIKRQYREDNTNSWAKDSLIAFASRRPGLYDKYELATIYLSYGQYTNMQTVLNYIDNNFEKSDDMQSDYRSFVGIMNIAKAMQRENLYEKGLNTNQRDSLITILDDDRPIVAPIALALLKRDNPNYVYNELVYNVSQSSPRLAAPQYVDNGIDDNKEFKLYPNPALDYVTLSYNCRFSNLTYSIIDISGREIKVGILETIETIESNEVLIDLTGIHPSVYYFVVKTNGISLYSEKFIIAK